MLKNTRPQTSVRLSIIGVLFLSLWGCSKEQAQTKRSNSSNDAVLAPSPAAAAPAEAAEENDARLNLGLPTYCTGERSAEAASEDLALTLTRSEPMLPSFCVTCKRFDFPVKHCFEARSDFDATKDCSFSRIDAANDELTCNYFNLKDKQKRLKQKVGKNQLEKTLEKLPLVSLGIKLFAQSKLKDKPKEAQLVADAMDFLEKYIKDILLGRRHQDASRDLATLFKKFESTLSETDITAIQQGSAAAFKTVSQKVAAGTKLTILDIMGLARDMVALLPPEKGQALSQYLDTGKILSTLGGLGGEIPDLSGIINSLLPSESEPTP